MKGLTCFISKPSASSAAPRVALIVKAGSLMEKENEQGLSHFLEHLLVDRLPGVSACTDFSSTVYRFCAPRIGGDHEDALSLRIRQAIMILSGETMSAQSIEKVRREVKAEYAAFSKEQKSAIRKLFAMEYPNLSLPIGEESYIERFQFAEAESFHRRWYQASNCALAVYSSLPEAQILELIDKEKKRCGNSRVSELANASETKQAVASKKESSGTGVYFISKYPCAATSAGAYIKLMTRLEIAIGALRIAAGKVLGKHRIFGDISGSVEPLTRDYFLLRLSVRSVASNDVARIPGIVCEANLATAHITEATSEYKDRIEALRDSGEAMFGGNQFIDECIKGFVFDEPMLELSEELGHIDNALSGLSMDMITACLDCIRENLVYYV